MCLVIQELTLHTWFIEDCDNVSRWFLRDGCQLLPANGHSFKELLIEGQSEFRARRGHSGKRGQYRTIQSLEIHLLAAIDMSLAMVVNHDPFARLGLVLSSFCYSGTRLRQFPLYTLYMVQGQELLVVIDSAVRAVHPSDLLTLY